MIWALWELHKAIKATNQKGLEGGGELVEMRAI